LRPCRFKREFKRVVSATLNFVADQMRNAGPMALALIIVAITPAWCEVIDGGRYGQVRLALSELFVAVPANVSKVQCTRSGEAVDDCVKTGHVRLHQLGELTLCGLNAAVVSCGGDGVRLPHRDGSSGSFGGLM
jgi:hypothetical protein